MESVSEKFDNIFLAQEKEFDELSQIVSSVEVMSDFKLCNHYMKKLKSLEPTVKLYKELNKLKQDIKELSDLALDDQSNEIQKEIDKLNNKQMALENNLRQVYSEQLKKENETIEIEINSKEDNEFVLLLKGLFEKYAASNEFEVKLTNKQIGSVSLNIAGENVYKDFGVFSGKVKKIFKGKETEAIVVVLKTENTEFELKEDDLEIQTSKSSGAGGQHINKTESAIKIIHKPTGIFAECQDERSQTKNKERALELLKKKITQNLQEKSEKLEKNQRKSLKDKIFGSTPAVIFDFDLNKVTVNSIKTDYKLKEILEGNLDLIFNDSVE